MGFLAKRNPILISTFAAKFLTNIKYKPLKTKNYEENLYVYCDGLDGRKC